MHSVDGADPHTHIVSSSSFENAINFIILNFVCVCRFYTPKSCPETHLHAWRAGTQL